MYINMTCGIHIYVCGTIKGFAVAVLLQLLHIVCIYLYIYVIVYLLFL